LSAALHAAAVFHHCRVTYVPPRTRRSHHPLARSRDFRTGCDECNHAGLGARASQGSEGRHGADDQGLQSLSGHRSSDKTTPFSGAARRSTQNHGTARDRTDNTHRSAGTRDTTGERWYEPELYRLKGELLLQQNSDNHTEAASCFQQALHCPPPAGQILELRTPQPESPVAAAGKWDAARLLLAPIYGWFTEGSIPRTSRAKRYSANCVRGTNVTRLPVPTVRVSS